MAGPRTAPKATIEGVRCARCSQPVIKTMAVPVRIVAEGEAVKAWLCRPDANAAGVTEVTKRKTRLGASPEVVVCISCGRLLPLADATVISVTNTDPVQTLYVCDVDMKQSLALSAPARKGAKRG